MKATARHTNAAMRNLHLQVATAERLLGMMFGPCPLPVFRSAIRLLDRLARFPASLDPLLVETWQFLQDEGGCLRQRTERRSSAIRTLFASRTKRLLGRLVAPKSLSGKIMLDCIAFSA
jgi:hypothetical protein